MDARSVRRDAMMDALDAARRLMRRCDQLAACSEEPGRITRPFPSAAMAAAHGRVGAWMKEAGLHVRTDAVGNLIGRKTAERADAPVVLVGSHLDSVRDAGRYDGTLGVLAGVELAHGLAGVPLPFHLDVVAFCDEEGLRFGATFFGSLAIAGRFPEHLLDVCDDRGVSLRDALREAGFAPDRIETCGYDAVSTIAFLEAHIEQGPRLEALERPLGVATAVAGQTKGWATFEGRAAHAGTTPMELRRDAVAAAAAWIVAVEAHARATPGLVATVGSVRTEPGATNVIAGATSCSLDVRHEDDAVRIAAVARAREAADRLSRERGVRAALQVAAEEPSRRLDPDLAARLERITGGPRMVSGAGHDAAVMSTFAPTALLFVRSPGGSSHHPDEAVLERDVAEALRALDALVRELADAHDRA